MKLSWKDIATFALVILGAVLVYAKVEAYAWPVIESWRSATLLMGIIAAGIFALDASDMRQDSTGSIVEIATGIGVVALFVASLLIATETAFVLLAVGMGAFWLLGLMRHVRHSYDADHIAGSGRPMTPIR